MSTGCKVWLWIVFIGNLLLLPMSATVLIAFICSIVNIIAIGILLFKQKKVGLYLFFLNAVINCLVSLSAGANVLLAVSASIVSPIITAAFVSTNADIFD